MSAKPTYTLSQIIHQLTTSWGGGYTGYTMSWPSSQSVITFSINSGVPTNSGGYPAEGNGYVPMDATQVATAELAFQLWDDLIAKSVGMTSRLVETTDPGANITLNYSSNTGGGTYTIPYVSSISSLSQSMTLSAAQVWLDSGWSTNGDSGMALGGYGLTTMIHEIGHALGLSHPGTYNAGSGGAITYANSAVYAQDNREYTVMSYFGGYLQGYGWQQDGTYTNYLYPQTPMVDDIAAIQAKYGADTTTRAGDTVYGFNCSLAASDPEKPIYDFSLNPNPILTIWDAGGYNTLDCSGYSGSQTISLIPGTYSSVDGLVGNVGIAFNTQIQHAIGGSGNDTLIGVNGSALTGGIGADTFKITAGSESVTDLGSGGADILNVAANASVTASAAGAWTATSATLNLGTATIIADGNNLNLASANASARGAHGYTLSNVGGAGGATMVGSTLSDTLIAGNSGDILTGGKGADTFDISAGLGSATQYVQITDYTAARRGGDIIKAADVMDAGQHLSAYNAVLPSGWTLSKGFAFSAGATLSSFYTMASSLASYVSGTVLGFTDGQNDYLFIMGEGDSSHDSLIELVGVHYTALGASAAANAIQLG